MKKIFVLTLLIFLLAVYTTVHAEYKIILKNGGKLTVKDYKKEGSSIRLYTTAGEMEIDQSNIESIKSVDIEEDANEPNVKPKEENVKTDENKKNTVKNTEDPLDPPIKVPPTKNDIKKKNSELKAEQIKLQEELKKLEEDMNKEGRDFSVRKKREFDKRAKELKKQLEEHNQKVEKFNQEKTKTEEN